MTLFTGSITLPDAGPQTQSYDKLDDLKLWLLACLRMDGDPRTLKVTAGTVDLTDVVGRDLTREILKGKT